MLPSNSNLDIVTSGFSGSDALIVSLALFEKYQQLIAPNSLYLNQVMFCPASKLQVKMWRRCIHYLMNTDCKEEAVNELLYMIMSNIYLANYDRLDDLPNTKQKQYELAKKIRTYIHFNYQHEVRLTVLSELLNVSVRTLQRCFKRYFNTSILSYLEAYRYYKVHWVLSNSKQRKGIVEYVSLAHGFNHFGRFSTGFHQHFNYSASKLLKF